MRGRQVREVWARESSSRSVSTSAGASARSRAGAAVAGASLAREPKPAPPATRTRNIVRNDRPVRIPPTRPPSARPGAAAAPPHCEAGGGARHCLVRRGGGAWSCSAAFGALHLRSPDPRRAPNPRDLDTRLARPPARRASARQPPEPPLRAAAPLGGRSRADFGGAISCHSAEKVLTPIRAIRRADEAARRRAAFCDCRPRYVFFAGRLVPALRISGLRRRHPSRMVVLDFIVAGPTAEHEVWE